MSVRVYISHNGGRFDADPGDAIPQAIANAGIPIPNQILLNPRGKHAKNLQIESEIFVFDKSLPPASVRSAQKLQIQEPPLTLKDETRLEAWQELFESRRKWTQNAVETIKHGVHRTEVCQDENEIISHSVGVALENLRRSLESLKQRFETTQKWAEQCLHEHTGILAEWRQGLDTVEQLTVRGDICAQLLHGKPSNSSKAQKVLRDCLSSDLEHNAASLSKSSSTFRQKYENFQEKADELLKTAKDAPQDTPAVDQKDLNGFLDEADALASRIIGDCEEVSQLDAEDSRSITTASRRALVHTKDLLPGLRTLVDELQSVSESATSARNKASQMCFRTLQDNSTLQSRLADVHSRMGSLDLDTYDDLDALSRVFRIPMLYGVALVDAVRRSEWLDSRVAEELALPAAERKELVDYIQQLRTLGIDDVVDSLSQMLRQLGQQDETKGKSKPRQNGSIHNLQHSSNAEERSRLDEKLRASESRVRKLEDLLHRQSQLQQNTSGTFSPTTPMDGQLSNQHLIRPPSSPSRRSSLSTRRLSNQATSEKELVQRIVQLEAEILKLQQEAHAERRSSTEHRDRMNEAEAVKKDLMANFEAQRVEFEEERQLLEEEVNKLKIRVEEAEDELDHALDSKMVQDQTVDVLRAEIEHAKRSRSQELERELEKLRKTLVSEHERTLERIKAMAADEHGQELESLQKTSVEEQERAISNLKHQLQADHEQELDGLQGTLGRIQAEHTKAAEEGDKMRKELSELRRNFATESQQELDRLKAALGETRENLTITEKTSRQRILNIMESLGYSITRPEGSDAFVIQRISKLTSSTGMPLPRRTVSTSDVDGREGWPSTVKTLPADEPLDLEVIADLIMKRCKDIETLAKKYQKESRAYREKSHRLQHEAHDKIAVRGFKEGDLALFLPTRDQATRPWAAFNINAPHYFLREQDAHKLHMKEYLLARITRVEERVVDMSKTLSASLRDQSSINAEASDGGSLRSVDDNPFELSDGLRWYMIDANEEKPGAPSTPSVGKSTAAISNIEVKGQVGRRKDGKRGSHSSGDAVAVTKTLNRNLESRRSSEASRKSVHGAGGLQKPPSLTKLQSSGAGNDREQAPLFDVASGQAGDRIEDRHTSASAASTPLKTVRSRSPLKNTPSPVKGSSSTMGRTTPSRTKTWDKLLNLEYNW